MRRRNQELPDNITYSYFGDAKVNITGFMISNEESMFPPPPASHVPLLSHFVTQAAKQGLGDGKK